MKIKMTKTWASWAIDNEYEVGLGVADLLVRNHNAIIIESEKQEKMTILDTETYKDLISFARNNKQLISFEKPIVEAVNKGEIVEEKEEIISGRKRTYNKKKK